jgi:phage terminase large subunit-like protein
LTQTEGASVDFDLVTQELIADMKRFNPEEAVFDPHNAMWMAQKVMEDGGNAVEFPQNAANMAPATDEFVTAVHDYRVHHNNNPMTNWCVSNLVARKNTGKLPVPTKQKPQNKIDGAIALIMGIGRAMSVQEKQNVIDGSYELMVV